MSLLRFTSDKGRGHNHSQVWLESTQVVAVVPITDDYNQSENRTMITLSTGLVERVREGAERCARMVQGIYSSGGSGGCGDPAVNTEDAR